MSVIDKKKIWTECRHHQKVSQYPHYKTNSVTALRQGSVQYVTLKTYWKYNAHEILPNSRR